MLSAFANCFKIPELRQRIIFTLCVIVVVRIGAAIPCPGINTEILARFFHDDHRKGPEQHRRRPVQSLQRRRAGKLRRLHPRHHPLHQRQHHAPVDDRGRAQPGQARPRGRRPAENHPVHPLRDHRHLPCPGLLLREAIRESRRPASSFPASTPSPASMARSCRIPEPCLSLPPSSACSPAPCC